METKEVIEQLIKQGAKRVNNLLVKNVHVTPKDNYVQVSFTLDKPVEGYIASAEDPTQFVLGETKVIFVNLFGIAALMKDNRRTAFAANHVVENPKSLEVLFSYAKVNIIQEKVEAGEYKNPFAGEKTKNSVLLNDTIINHVIGFEFDEEGLETIKDLRRQKMGF